MNIERYLQRIRFDRPTVANVETIRCLMQAHLTSVPFENLDVQLGHVVTTCVENAYAKIVEQNRGGWCYEQNGLFGWALSELGFDVMRIAAAVGFTERGSSTLNNHLALRVRCPDGDTSYLVDVGFGGGQFAPIALKPQSVQHDPFDLELTQNPGDRWLLTERYTREASSYQFVNRAADEVALAKKCEWLQSDPESAFVLNLVIQRRQAHAHLTLRGRVLREISAAGERKRLLQSADELVAQLQISFDLNIPEARDLWPRIVARHTTLFGDVGAPIS